MMRDSAGCGTRYPPIGAYAVIGDCHTAALISLDGAVDWYCPRRFDAPAVFCRLLDAEKGGFLRLAPVDRFSASRRYRGPTNVLETTFSADSGQVRVTDLPLRPLVGALPPRLVSALPGPELCGEAADAPLSRRPGRALPPQPVVCHHRRCE